MNAQKLLSLISGVRRVAAEYREANAADPHGADFSAGYVIVYQGPDGPEVAGWTHSLAHAPSAWVPGSVAVPPAGPCHVAAGGNENDGAERWEEIDDGEVLAALEAEKGEWWQPEPDAAPEAMDALHALAEMAWQNRGTGGGAAAWDMLRSLYDGQYRCDLSSIQWLDALNRERMVLVLQNIGREPLWDYSIREAFRTAGGEAAAEWFSRIGAPEGEEKC